VQEAVVPQQLHNGLKLINDGNLAKDSPPDHTDPKQE
jgi:hypothetical protein